MHPLSEVKHGKIGDSTSASTHVEYRPDVDGLRAVAILAVIGFHASSRLVPGGFVGVDVFFVISGFLISGLILKGLEEETFSIADFYLRRIRRIFPALIIVFAASLVAGWFWLHASDYMLLGKHLAAAAAFVSNFVFWGESGYFDTFAELKPMLHLWSLGVEEQFYMVWPVLLLVVWKLSRWRVWIFALIAGGSFFVNIVTAKVSPLADFYLPVTRFWELLLGGILAYAGLGNRGKFFAMPPNWFPAGHSARADAWIRNASAALGSVLLAGAVIELDRTEIFPGWRALLPAGGTFLLIAAGPRAWINKILLANPILVFVGLISYPLYLWHWPILAFLRINNFDEPLRIQKALCIALAFVLAGLTYALVERPVRRSAFGRFHLPVPMALCALMTASFLAGLYVYATGGFPGRYSATENAVDTFTRGYRENLEKQYRYGTCFLNPEQGGDAFAEDCVEPANGTGRPLVVLWGDSHAAHFYRGLHHAQHVSSFRLAQFTAASCPPMLAYRDKTRPFCPDVNRRVMEYIRSMKPDLVVLSAVWTSYDYGMIADTIASLKSIGISLIVVIGPVPYWDGGFPKSLYAYFKKNQTDRIPARLGNHYIESYESSVDSKLREIATQAGAIYRSPIQLLCNPEGCITRVGDRPEDIVTWDYGHLTTLGSEYVIRALLSDVLHLPGPLVAPGKG